MKNHLIAALMSVAIVSPVLLPVEATAQRRDDDRRWQGDRDNRNWDPAGSYRQGKSSERRLGRNDRIYRGKDGRAYCKRNDGTTGLVIGAVGGGLLANLIAAAPLARWRGLAAAHCWADRSIVAT